MTYKKHSIIISVLILIFLSFFGGYVWNMKTSLASQDSDQEYIQTFSLSDSFPVSLSLSSKYALHVSEFFEGIHVINVYVLSKKEKGVFGDTGVNFSFSIGTAIDEESIRKNPSQLLDRAGMKTRPIYNVEHITIFGNPALQFADDNENVYVLGYISPRQVEYGAYVQFNYSSYGREVSEDKDFIDTIIQSLVLR